MKLWSSVNMFGLSDNIMYWSDDVLGSESMIRASLLDLEVLSAVCTRVAYSDAILHRLDADKGLFFLSLLFLELILYGSGLHGVRWVTLGWTKLILGWAKFLGWTRGEWSFWGVNEIFTLRRKKNWTFLILFFNFKRYNSRSKLNSPLVIYNVFFDHFGLLWLNFTKKDSKVVLNMILQYCIH